MTSIRQEIAQLEAAIPPSFYVDFDGSRQVTPLTEAQEAAERRALMLGELLDLRHLDEEWLTAMHFGWCCNPEINPDSDPMGDMMGRNY